MAKVYVSILPQPNYVCAVSLNLGGNRLPSVFSLADPLLPLNYGERYDRQTNTMDTMVYAWINLGMGHRCSCCCIFTIPSNVAYQKLDVPPIVNTVETIPVDVYKLEKVIVEY